MISTCFGTLDYMESGDRLALRHNLRVDAMRMLDAAAHNRAEAVEADAGINTLLLDIARRQERNARNLIEDARLSL